MLGYIQANLSTILISIGLAAVVAGIIVKMIRDKRVGSCGCGCDHCPAGGGCRNE